MATGGVVTPGLMDLHNHLAYNTLPLWQAPRTTPYETRYQWPGAVTYGRDISNPAQALGIAAAAATLRYAEVKAAVGGVTAIQGSPPLTRAFPGWMVRNVEKDPVGGGDTVRQSVLKVEPDRLDDYAAAMAAGRSFFYHLAEGTSPKLRTEYTELAQHGCAGRGLVGHPLHGAHGRRLRRLGTARVPSCGRRSPTSGSTAAPPTSSAARESGHLVCLGSDWVPSGSRNLLGELKVADLWNRERLGGALTRSSCASWRPATPGSTMERAWKVPVGRLVAGGLADLAVHRPRDADPYRSLIAATERDVRLVVVGGRPVYGLASLLRAADAIDVEPITVARRRRGVVMTLPDELLPQNPVQQREATMSWAEGLAVLDSVHRDPAGAVRRARLPVRGGRTPAVRARHARRRTS